MAMPEAGAPELSDQDLGRTLRARREERGLTLAEASAQMGIPTTSLHRYEKGQRPIPFDRLQVAAMFYGYRTVGEFLDSAVTLRVRLIASVA